MKCWTVPVLVNGADEAGWGGLINQCLMRPRPLVVLVHPVCPWVYISSLPQEMLFFPKSDFLRHERQSVKSAGGGVHPSPGGLTVSPHTLRRSDTLLCYIKKRCYVFLLFTVASRLQTRWLSWSPMRTRPSTSGCSSTVSCWTACPWTPTRTAASSTQSSPPTP